MRLLSAKEIYELIVTPNSALQIANFSAAHLQHTFYYVRLGEQFFRPTDGLLDEEGDLHSSIFIEFAPSEYLRVFSHERFRLDQSILGIIGGVSDAARQGLALVSGQFIDPMYPGVGTSSAPLEFGLKNLSQTAAAIRKHDP